MVRSSPVIRAWQACEGKGFDWIETNLQKDLKELGAVWDGLKDADVDVFSENLWQVDDRRWR